MCKYCGCPEIEPFATLTDEHATLDLLAELYAGGGSSLDLEAIRVSWEDHLASQSAVRSLARSLDLEDVIDREAQRPDESLNALLARPVPNGHALWGAIRGHIEAWEFDVFPRVVLSADPAELAEAARDAAAARAS
jgi:hypothetical protein